MTPELTLEELDELERYFITSLPGHPVKIFEALAAARAYLNPWKPISEAPKDGTTILLVDPNGWIATGYWEPAWKIVSDNRWVTGGGEAICPTHFAPLPKGPKE